MSDTNAKAVPDFSHHIPCPEITDPDLRKSALALMNSTHLIAHNVRGLLALLMDSFDAEDENGRAMAACWAADSMMADLQALCNAWANSRSAHRDGSPGGT